MPPPDPVDVLEAGDPLAVFTAGHREHRLLALRTSGTAGSPRTVVRTTDSWVDSFPHVSALLGLDSSSRVWVPGPLTATMNLFAAAHTEWAGASLAPGPRDATHAHLTPWALRRELATGPDALAGLHILTAGDRLERTTYDAARSVGAEVSHYYGAAELSFVAWGDHADALRPFPGVEVASRDGALWVRSACTCQGYREEGRALQRDANGWVTVGNRGEVINGFVRVHGRDGGSRHDDVPRLRSRARRVLDPAQRPRRWLHLDPLPLTATGKIDRVALAAEVAAMVTRGGDE